MNMFCYQCQETAKNSGCSIKGVCGKEASTAGLQDSLIYACKGLASVWEKANAAEAVVQNYRQALEDLLIESLFATITNANFDNSWFVQQTGRLLGLKGELIKTLQAAGTVLNLTSAENWVAAGESELLAKAPQVGVLARQDEDKRSLVELLTYGLKGVAAYAHHAAVLGYRDKKVNAFFTRGLAATLDTALSADDLLGLVVECGEQGVNVMALLDAANTETYGHPEPTQVNLGVRGNPGILVSGHDLKDLEELLEQTVGSGVDVYTHGEMLPAHSYPFFKKYPHLAGNYGGSWWKQTQEFASFQGPILMTTNCLVPPKDIYRERVFTTGVSGFNGLTHIPDRQGGKAKDFSALIALAKKCAPPQELETGTLSGGFAHQAVLGVADKVIEAIKSGRIKKFVVMAGCDGRHRSRDYYTEFAEKLPDNTIILTAGCAKYRYNKLPLGDIAGIPRVLDAGQCNDSYSLVVVALKLAEAFGVGVNELPIVYNIAWYEQKAVIVLLALLSLGVKKIHLGPTLPAFLSPNVTSILIDKFELAGTLEVEEDLKQMIG